MELKKIQSPVQRQLDAVDHLLREKFRIHKGVIRRMMGKTPIQSGKRIRPTLMFLLAGARESSDPQLPAIASELELIHLSSLIHDDVMDHSTMRRGRKSLNMDEGNQMSILWGDYLFISAFRSLNRIGHSPVVQTAMDVAVQMIEGQMLELDHQHDLATTRKSYLSIIRQKTGSLFAGIARIVANLDANLDADPGEYERFGMSFGTLFQMQDDLIDIFSTLSGKDRFRDLMEGKITLPLILLLEENRETGEELLKKRDFSAIDILMRERGILENMKQMTHQYASECHQFLRAFPPSIFRDSLDQLVEFIESRDY